MTGQTLTDRIEAAMKAQGLGLREFAAAIDVDHSILSRFLNGKQKGVSRGTARKLAAALGLDAATMDELLAAPAPAPDSAAAMADQIADAVTDRLVERFHDVLTRPNPVTVLQPIEVEEDVTLDDRIPVMFSGVVWDELTDEEKRGVIALVKRLMGRPQGKMGRRVDAESPPG